MLQSIEFLIWFCLFMIVYSYAIYPLLLLIYSGCLQLLRDIVFVVGGRDRRSVRFDAASCPSVSVVISAFNEEKCISERIQNLFELDYPREKIHFYIGSDGSADDTVEIAMGYRDSRLTVVNFELNRGKAVVINDLLAMANGEVIVFSDANTFYEPDAVKMLVRHFQDKQVGAVCGELKLVNGDSQENLDGLYWKYERVLKFNESRIGVLLGANGAIYAIRKSLYEPIPNDTLIDDFTIALSVSLKGNKVIYDPEAVATEEVAPSTGDEFKRRVRIGSGNYQALHRFVTLLNPLYGSLFWAYFSHKVLRWIAPFLLFFAFLGSMVLSLDNQFYAIFSMFQLLIYIVSYYSRNTLISNSLLNFLVFFVNMNIALGLGAVRYYRGSAKGSWDSTRR
jgi:cellulose synthase/poly-beta-1,6-N-acetylglucosamine synthase-like glycosyltransferase